MITAAFGMYLSVRNTTGFTEEYDIGAGCTIHFENTKILFVVQIHKISLTKQSTEITTLIKIYLDNFLTFGKQNDDFILDIK